MGAPSPRNAPKGSPNTKSEREMGAPKGSPKNKSTLQHLFALDPVANAQPAAANGGKGLPSPCDSEMDELLCTISSCTRVFTFADPGESSFQQELKRHRLSRLLSFVRVSKGAWPDQVLSSLVSMLAANLFRPLPPPAHAPGPDCLDEESPLAAAYAPQWPHLHLVYDVLSALVGGCEPKALRAHLDKAFLAGLLALFRSEDPRERERLKGVYHQMYARFDCRRRFLRKSMKDELLRFAAEGERHSGVGELLEVWGSIISGFAVPIKEEHRVFLARVLLPLHKSKGMHLYHKQLTYCVCQFVVKEPELGEVVVRGMLRCWPSTDCQKQVLLIGELEELVESTEEDQLVKLALPVCSQIARCLSSCNSQVAERALFVWNSERFVRMASTSMAEVLPAVVEGIEKNIRSHWSQSVRELTISVKKMLEEMEPWLYAQCLADLDRRESDAAEEEMKRKARWDRLEMAAAKL